MEKEIKIKRGKKIIIELTEEQYIALKEFMTRVSLIGKEVPGYIDVMTAISKGGVEENGE